MTDLGAFYVFVQVEAALAAGPPERNPRHRMDYL